MTVGQLSSRCVRSLFACIVAASACLPFVGCESNGSALRMPAGFSSTSTLEDRLQERVDRDDSFPSAAEVGLASD